MPQPDWQPWKSLIAPAQRIIVSSHIRPDADALGSEIALTCYLKHVGKSPTIMNASPTPAHLAFLDPYQWIQQLRPTTNMEEVLSADLHIIVDTSSWQQLGEFASVLRKSQAPRIVIDHHVSADDLQAHEFKDPQRASTGELIYELMLHEDYRPEPLAATALFAAIATDTGWFRFPATSPLTYRAAADLITYGADPSAIYRAIYEQMSLGRIQLMARVLSRLQLKADGRVAVMWVHARDFSELQAVPADTEDIVNYGLKIAGVEAAVIAVEYAPQSIKLSLRSRSGLDVAKIAEELGGGGHRQAAGAALNLPLETALKIIVDKLTGALRPQPADSQEPAGSSADEPSSQIPSPT